MYLARGEKINVAPIKAVCNAFSRLPNDSGENYECEITREDKSFSILWSIEAINTFSRAVI